MRSIPLAITWEMLRRGRWSIVAGALGANALPLLLLALLRYAGAVEPMDQSQITLHMALVPINMFLFATCVFGALGAPSRLYAFPMPTSAIVTWHLGPAMAAVALEGVVSTVLLNTIFHLDWPIWGPALFAAVAVAALQATLWLTEEGGKTVGESLGALVAIGCVGGILGIWFKSRYGAPFSLPNRFWASVTAAEVVTMLTVAVVAYFGAVWGVARRRCGDSLDSSARPGWAARLNRFEAPFESALDVERPFPTPVSAQLWFGWRKTGWAMPAACVCGLCLWIIIWLIVNRDVQDLCMGFIIVGGFLSMGGFVGGMMLGNTGSSDKKLEMGPFLATRPMSNTHLAHTILITATKSVLIAWAIWAASFLILYLICVAIEATPALADVRALRWWYFPATLLGAWTVTGVMASASLTGRQNLIAKVIIGLITLAICQSVFSNLALSPQAQVQWGHGLLVVGGAVFVLGTAWAFLAACRRSLIRGPTLIAALIVWTALTLLDGLESVRHPAEPVSCYLFVAGLLALSVAPLATAPLALAWNRTR